MSGPPRIASRQLERLAVVYVRQSTPGQVLKNRESQLRQYRLAERAGEMGWPEERVLVIDSDLGRSAASQGGRDGFEQLCDHVSEGRVGAIFGIEAGRLARNTVEWFQLLDLCRVNETVLIEDNQVYAPGREDDGLILGIKGTFSAAELSVLRARMEGGRRSKAQRGELYASLPVGFVRDGGGVRKDPDLRVRAAIEAVFARFREGGSGFQATVLLRESGVQLPSRPHGSDEVVWREAVYSRVKDILTNPMMGGAYAYGKARLGYRDDGTRLAPEERWRVLKPDHHEGYVSWQEWLDVQDALAANSTVPLPKARGCARGGGASAGPCRLRPLRPGDRGPLQQGPELLLQPARAGLRPAAQLLLGRRHRDRQGRRPPVSRAGLAGRGGGGARCGAGGGRARQDGSEEPAAGA